MRAHRTFVRIAVGIGLVVVIALLVGSRANAIIIVNNKTAHFGPFGLARGQTARINVVNVDDPKAPPSEVQPGACRVKVGFVDSNGRRLAERTIIINWSTTKSFDFVPPSDTDRIARGGTRMELRAFVAPPPEGDAPPPDPDRPAPTCVATLEVFDSNTGQTTLFSEHGLVDPGDTPAPR